ncbi:host attachment family protein [Lysobacter xanthus]
MQNVPAGTLVVVADGRKARMFRNVGDANALSLRQHELMDAADIPLQGPSGVAPPQRSVAENDEATFAMHVARRLNDGALTQDYAHLVIVADPQTLGEMRPQLHKETLQRLIGEIPKTLTNSPLEDIERALH